ncbi:uncharacterized protein A4U43_C01F7270 [Asparagus officinalis]|uniref:Pectinesterase n=1 Tax=Asparagus officinalis TaxID=4686 RepID=A0A5P1FMR9_ASPOF|nr:putative pectinesterase 63 [Asparagus officinalis]ONK79528.1 uncharacterized protein A4U43_C01F7270 [Asparagus officinalis]
MYGKLARLNFPPILLISFFFLHSMATGINISLRCADLNPQISNSSKGFKKGEIAQGNSIDPELASAEKQPKIITVRKNGKGDFRTLREAINSIPSGNKKRTILRIGPGVYKEKVTVDRLKPYITFYGEPDQMPRITFDATASQYGTINSATVAVESDYFVASNIIFENSSPKPILGMQGSQAVAMRISGDKAAFYNCRFYGHQDTLCDDKGLHFFKDCYIRGTVDFIFGDGRSIYSNCKLVSIADGVTAITAQGRYSTSDNSAFVFLNCNITGTGNAFLGRAWKENSRVVFAYTYMGNLINPRGWDDKGYSNRQGSVFYGEYKSQGPGAATKHRVKFTKLLTDEQAKPFVSMNFIQASQWLKPPPKLVD